MACFPIQCRQGAGTGGAGAPTLSHEAKRQRILEGMLEVVGEVGYDRVSVRAVLERTGLYRQAFYDHFRCKHECYLKAYDAALARIEGDVGAAISLRPSWRERLRTGLGTLLDFLDAEPLVARALIVEVHPAGSDALARRAAALARAHAFLDRAREEPGANASAPPIVAGAVASGIHAVVHSRLATGERSGFRPLLPELMYVAVLPYFGDRAARAEMRA